MLDITDANMVQKVGISWHAHNVMIFKRLVKARPEFAYPYCYKDHEVTFLCAHVEEEHPLDWRYSLHNVLVWQKILDVQKSSRVFGMVLG